MSSMQLCRASISFACFIISEINRIISRAEDKPRIAVTITILFVGFSFWLRRRQYVSRYGNHGRSDNNGFAPWRLL